MVPTRRWLAAVRTTIAPGTTLSRWILRPVLITASPRVVGTPSACMASDTRYSRSIGPSAPRPSEPGGKMACVQFLWRGYLGRLFRRARALGHHLRQGRAGRIDAQNRLAHRLFLSGQAGTLSPHQT